MRVVEFGVFARRAAFDPFRLTEEPACHVKVVYLHIGDNAAGLFIVPVPVLPRPHGDAGEPLEHGARYLSEATVADARFEVFVFGVEMQALTYHEIFAVLFCLFIGGKHSLAVCGVERHRFFGKHVVAALQHFGRYFGVQEGGHANVHKVNVLAAQHLLIIRVHVEVPAAYLGGVLEIYFYAALYLFGVDVAYRNELFASLRFKLKVRVLMALGYTAEAYHCCFYHGCSPHYLEYIL